MSPGTRRRVAIHEAGHTIVGRILDTSQFLAVSIDETGGVAEFAATLDLSISQRKIDDLICLMLGGRAAETLLLGDVALGSALGDDSDLSRATKLAEMIETKGMGKVRNLYLPSDLARNLLHAPGLMAAVKGRLDEAEARAIDILNANRPSLDAIARRLEETGYLSAADIDRIVAECPTKEAAEW